MKTDYKTEHLNTAENQGISLNAPSVAFYTLGCKTNQLETATLANQFKALGWQIADFNDAADLFVINTCTVTERSDLEAQRIIRRARLSNPSAKIAVTGCYTQIAPEAVAKQKGVNYVIGNNFKDQLATWVDDDIRSGSPQSQLVQVSEIDKSRIMVGATEAALDRTRASLKIQDGCDYKCTYCIIWKARGKSRSLPASDVETQLQRLIDEGFKEVVLTGINIGQYLDETTTKHIDLAKLLNRLVALPGNFRLRLSSLDPMEVDTPLIESIAGSAGKICPHIHLSAQSANDVVLKHMARRHHVRDFQRVCHQIQSLIPGACVGSDIIVGFPGETDTFFQETINVIENLPLHYCHVFSYSKRQGTPAAVMTGQISESVKKKRANQLRALSSKKMRLFIQSKIDSAAFQSVLVESNGQSGLSQHYLRFQFAPGVVFPPNSLQTCLIKTPLTTETPLNNTVLGETLSLHEEEIALEQPAFNQKLLNEKIIGQ
ncbi:MAG: tRNA (N(6)-L-threonylcarbamoyladenosine(37)-C(2))-methylthiotransferase MtaB [Cyanobacteria bacterium P01_H01_bin.74]